jgi:hypothetical protein
MRVASQVESHASRPRFNGRERHPLSVTLMRLWLIASALLAGLTKLNFRLNWPQLGKVNFGDRQLSLTAECMCATLP